MVCWKKKVLGSNSTPVSGELCSVTQTNVRRNIMLLSVCQALSVSGSTLVIAITALTGKWLAPNPGLATLPIALQFAVTMVTTIPASYFMAYVGRRVGFTCGQVIGIIGALLATWSIIEGWFWLFAISSGLIGAHNAFWQYYRFAAAESAGKAFRARAISYVLAGGILAAFVGPQLAKWNIDLFAPYRFAGAYFVICILGIVTVALLQFVRIPNPVLQNLNSGGRRIREIARQPEFFVAVLSSAIGYGIMNLLMTSTPLAMKYCGYEFSASATVIQWHVFGMFFPSFFTGHLIRWMGTQRVILTGSFAIAACIGINLYDTAFINFFTSLFLLGIGWNFLFIGGTHLLTHAYTAEERAKVQAAHDFIVFGTVAVTAFFSGAIQQIFGWFLLNLIALAPIGIVAFVLFWCRAHLKKSDNVG